MSCAGTVVSPAEPAGLVQRLSHRGRCLPDFEWSRERKNAGNTPRQRASEGLSRRPDPTPTSFLEGEGKDLLNVSSCSAQQSLKLRGWAESADTGEAPLPGQTQAHNSAPARPWEGSQPENLGRQPESRERVAVQ